MDESSGTRYDSYGNQHLTDYNTVASAAGKVDTAASFTAANQEELYISDDGTWDLSGGEFTMCAWVYFTGAWTAGQVKAIITKWYDAAHPGDICEFRFIGWYENPAYWLYGTTTQTCDVHGTLDNHGVSGFAKDAWHFCVFSVGTSLAASQTLHIRLNSTVGDWAHSGTICYNAGSYVEFGGSGRRYSTNFWNGYIDEVGFWKRQLTLEEELFLYNGGTGRRIV